MNDSSDTATRSRPRTAARFNGDLYIWAIEQAQLLREGRVAEIELDDFPLECAYSWDEIMERPIEWPPGP